MSANDYNIITLDLEKMLYYIANRGMHDLAHDLHPSGIGYSRVLRDRNVLGNNFIQLGGSAAIERPTKRVKRRRIGEIHASVSKGPKKRSRSVKKSSSRLNKKVRTSVKRSLFSMGTTNGKTIKNESNERILKLKEKNKRARALRVKAAREETREELQKILYSDYSVYKGLGNDNQSENDLLSKDLLDQVVRTFNDFNKSISTLPNPTYYLNGSPEGLEEEEEEEKEEEDEEEEEEEKKEEEKEEEDEEGEEKEKKRLETAIISAARIIAFFASEVIPIKTIIHETWQTIINIPINILFKEKNGSKNIGGDDSDDPGYNNPIETDADKLHHLAIIYHHTVNYIFNDYIPNKIVDILTKKPENPYATAEHSAAVEVRPRWRANAKLPHNAIK